MLNKEYCEKCWNRDKIYCWDKFDETNWIKGKFVFCKARKDIKSITYYQDIDKDPPIECYYRLEHILKEN
jgi:hypothetical protein